MQAGTADYEVVDDGRDRLTWLNARRSGIGASDSPAILGMSNWGNSLSVYADKVRPVPDSEGDEESKPWLRVGRELEPTIIRVTAEDLGAKGFQCRKHMVRSRAHPFLQATMDGIIEFAEGNEWTEAKFDSNPEDWAEGMPKRVWIQVQHQMAVLNVDSLVVGALLAGRGAKFINVRVPRDNPFIEDALIPACASLWEKVLAEDPSSLEVDGAEYSRIALQRLYPEDDGGIEFLEDETYLDVADEISALSESIKASKKRKDTLKNELLQLAGTAKRLNLADGRYFNTGTVRRKEHVVKASQYRSVTGPFGKAGAI